MADNMPAAEVPISEELVRDLLAEQHADLAELPLAFVSEGWDSQIYKLGDTYAVRLPRRQINADLLPGELKWLPQLAPQLPLPISSAVRAGQPGCGYPWQWSITPWFDGTTWAEGIIDDTAEAARVLGEFVGALGTAAPDEVGPNPYRGGPLTERDPALRDRVELLGDSVDGARVLAIWDAALAAPPNTKRLWGHGDLHPANIVIDDGHIVAVIDWVDLNAGDTAYDLAAAWMCFPDAGDRATFRAATGVTDDATWVRAHACALSHGLACLASSADNARMHEVGQRTLDAVLADA